MCFKFKFFLGLTNWNDSSPKVEGGAASDKVSRLMFTILIYLKIWIIFLLFVLVI